MCVQLVAAMNKYEPGKASYMDRIRNQQVRQASRSDVLGFARDVETAMAAGRLAALVDRAKR